MLMADTMAIFFTVLGFMLAFIGLWLLCRGLWPVRVGDAAASCGKGLLKSFFVGLPLAAMTVIAVIVFSNLGAIGKVMVVAIICSYVIYSSIGVAGLATCIGERLASKTDEIKGPWRATLRGSVVLVLSFLPPVLGWFVILPITYVIGCGAATLSLLKSAVSFIKTKASLPPAQATGPAINATNFSIENTVGTPQ
jgi:hypothetical protein